MPFQIWLYKPQIHLLKEGFLEWDDPLSRLQASGPSLGQSVLTSMLNPVQNHLQIVVLSSFSWSNAGIGLAARCLTSFLIIHVLPVVGVAHFAKCSGPGETVLLGSGHHDKLRWWGNLTPPIAMLNR